MLRAYFCPDYPITTQTRASGVDRERLRDRATEDLLERLDGAAPMSSTCWYLGHVDPGKTFWYLQAAPELMAFAGKRLERQLGAEQ
jgi:hypothetical protein